MEANVIGLAIGTKREALGISQQALADRVGLSRPYISQVEAGTKKPADETLLKIMAALGMGYTDFGTSETVALLSREERAMMDAGMPFISKLSEYLTPKQFNEVMQLLNQTNEARAAMQAHLKGEPMPSGPDGWLNLSKEDRRLVQRIVNRLLKGKEQ